MNPTGSSYVEYGTGNMLNLDAGTVKRKIDSNEYDDEIQHEVQPNGKRACGTMSMDPLHYGSAPQTPKGPENNQGNVSAWSQSNPSPFLRTAMVSHAQHATMGHGLDSGFAMGYQTPESAFSSVAASPAHHSMDMDMEPTQHQDSPAIVQNTGAMLNATLSSPMAPTSATLLPSALPVQNGNEFVPVHGRSMEIPSYARVPLNEVRKYRDQRWSSCIYGADTRMQGMMM